MNRFVSLARFCPWLALLTALSLAFALFCRLDVRMGADSAKGRGSFIEWMFTASRAAFGKNFYIEADDVFHKGARISRADSFAGDPFRKIMDEVAPEGHRHAEGQSVAEIMPYMKFAMEMDPTNLETFLVTAYWLQAVGEMEEAEQVLREGMIQNPASPQLLLEKGKLCLRRHDYQHAARTLDAALRTWPGKTDPIDLQVQLDHAETYAYRALLYEVTGDLPRAADMLQQELALFPERTTLHSRIDDLRAGKPGLAPAFQRLNSALAKRPAHLSNRTSPRGLSPDAQAKEDDDHDHGHGHGHEHEQE